MNFSHWKQLTALTLFIALAVPAQVAAQALAKHNHYKFVDFGTFGAPASYFSGAGTGARVLNNQGTVAGYADTSTPDFYGPPNCWNSDCFMSEASRWQDGVIQKLGALPGQNSSAVTAINGHGWIVGYSQDGLIDPLNGAPAYVPILWKNGKGYHNFLLSSIESTEPNKAFHASFFLDFTPLRVGQKDPSRYRGTVPICERKQFCCEVVS